MSKKKYFKKQLRLWHKRLGLTSYQIDTLYYGNFDGVDAKRLCTIEPTWEYKRAIVSVNLSILGRSPKSFINRTIIHELSHALIDSASDGGKGIELAATMTERALSYAWEGR